MMSEEVVRVQSRQGVTNNNGNEISKNKFNFSYLISLDGIIKIVELILGIVCISLCSRPFFDGTQFFLFAIPVAILHPIIWGLIYIFNVPPTDHTRINWKYCEMGTTAACILCIFIAGVLILTAWANVIGYHKEENIAAGAITMINVIVFSIGVLVLLIQRNKPIK